MVYKRLSAKKEKIVEYKQILNEAKKCIGRENVLLFKWTFIYLIIIYFNSNKLLLDIATHV